MRRRSALVVAGMGAITVGALVFLGGGTTTGQLGTVGDMPNRVLIGPDRDVPCEEVEGKAPECATPVPTIPAADKALGKALVVKSLTVPLDHGGEYRVYLGQAVLARGVIERMSFSLRNAADGNYRAPVFYLELEDAETKAIVPTNVYAKGLEPRPQPVNVYLRFDLQSFDKGATVEVADIDVR